MSKTVALIQARMSSSRYPGKVLEDLAGRPLIVYMVERASRARSLDKVVVVTSVDATDDALCAVLQHHGIGFLRGDLEDVLARFKHAADHLHATEIVRLTGDCPLVDPEIVDAVVAARADSQVDYASNVDPPTFPDGFDVECFSMETLQRAFLNATDAAEREHVTLWMRSPRSGLTRHNVRALADLSHLRLTVDYPDDLDVVRRVVSACEVNGRPPDLFDILRVLSRNPEIRLGNPHVRNEGSAKSLASGE